MLYGLKEGTPIKISSHIMEKILKKENHGVFSHFNAIYAIKSTLSIIHPYIQNVLSHHQ